MAQPLTVCALTDMAGWRRMRHLHARAGGEATNSPRRSFLMDEWWWWRCYE
jgi:hypothetical protein